MKGGLKHRPVRKSEGGDELVGSCNGSRYDPTLPVSAEVQSALRMADPAVFKELPVCLLRRNPQYRKFFRGAKP